MNNLFLFKLNEETTRILIGLIIFFILFFIIVGYIALLIEKTMKKQSKRAGEMMHNVTKAKVITNEKDFIRFGNKKNNQLFIKRSVIPFFVILLGTIIYVINGLVMKNFSFVEISKGFATIFFQWDFEGTPTVVIFGVRVISEWPELINVPHFEAQYWASYIIYPAYLTGIIWLMVNTQAYIAIHFKLKKIGHQVFNPTIDPEFQNNNVNLNNNHIKNPNIDAPTNNQNIENKNQ